MIFKSAHSRASGNPDPLHAGSPPSRGRAQTCPVLAARLRPRFAPNKGRSGLCEAIYRSPSKRRASGNKGRRSAERRKPSVVRTVPPIGRGRGSDPSGDRSPSGAPQRRLPRRANARTQPRPRFTRNTMRRRYLRLESRLSEAPRAPVVMPEGTMPGPPGSGVTSPARRNRTRSINWLSPVDVPDVSETARLWSSRRQSQRFCICADESGRFAPCGFLKRARTELDSLAAIKNSSPVM